MMLVTLEEARLHLRVDAEDDDPDLTLKIHAASGAIINYLKKPAFIDETGALLPEAVPFEVKASVLLLLGYLYKNRDEDPGKEFNLGFLPPYVTALLYPLRDPAIA
ncbi:head-tail connector protein [Pseudomonas luteola]|uniref:head-tail connector protein n=1 Tax=Pseudomonas luteola TaxID=47886 RepID=UPI00123B990C|nr:MULTISPECIES: head-tail connector protein [Pseudomonas]MBA1249849.1 phage gp6-like head-tail connector protein [Pseudomonas zeshuii]QEU28843.1 phage gp6-like head-tail connector protein [Pseudomonas luteola]